MVTKDVSRDLLQQKKNYIGARLQQGRAVLDSDFNEHAALGREDQRRVLVDAIGPAGSPDKGFSIRRPLAAPASEPDRLLPGTIVPSVTFGATTSETPRLVHPVALRAGAIYAGGLRFDLEGAEALLHQRDFLQLKPSDLPLITTGASVRYLYYLRGWEQCVSALEDQELRDTMLRGPDTSVRVRRMRRVEVFELGTTPAVNCDEAWDALRSRLQTLENGTFDEKSFELRSAGRLQLTFVGGEAEDTCAPCDPHGRRYLGSENQTLRVLLTSPTTFVWALDNPRLVRVRVLGLDQVAPAAVRVELLDRPTEERDWPFENRVVEIIPFAALLDGAEIPGPLDPHYRKIADEVGVFTRALETFDPAVGSFAVDQGDGTNDILAKLKALVHAWPAEHPDAAKLNVSDAEGARYFYMRVWHQAPTRAEIELPTAAPPVLGTTGIEPVFTAGHRGDYWVAALRPETPKQVVPFELLKPGGAPPQGPRRFFAPLSFVTLEGDTVTSAEDCRPRVRPLNNRLCTKYTVGDGVHSFGDFTRIGDAIAALSRSGGVISVRPGVYRESISILSRDDVTIEGCGPSTILRSDAAPTSGVAVVSLGNCQRIQLRGFAIETQGAAIHVAKASNVSLSELEIATGDFRGVRGAFRPGRGSSTSTQVNFLLANHVSISDVTLRPNRQRGVAFLECWSINIEHLHAVGSTRVSAAFPPPMLEFTATRATTVRDCTFQLKSQPGILLSRNPASGIGCRNFEFSHLDIDAGAVLEGISLFTPIFAPFDVDGSATELAEVRLRESRIRMRRQLSEFAAISVRGQRITLENNRITADADATFGPLAWSGIHVRGGSGQVTIRGNHIMGGAGHGVTLGSVRWVLSGQADRRSGPGRGQMLTAGEGSVVVTGGVSTAVFDSLTFSAVDEGQVSDVLIADNRIEEFSTNGISAIGVLGLAAQDLIEVARVRIERNHIRDNVRRPQLAGAILNTSTLPFPTSRKGGFLSVPTLPLGGIVLANGRNIELTDNVIVDNGQTNQATSAPLNGIFVLAGDAIVIEGNRITNNGQLLETSDPALAIGARAGIAVMLAGTSSSQGSAQSLNDFLFESSDNLDNRGVALRVVNNTVRHPEGRALHAVAAGPVSVDGNFLASQGNHGNPERKDQFAVGDVVYIQNLGAPWETYQFSPIISPFGVSAEYATELTPQLSPILMHGSGSPSPRWFTGLGGGILFVNNQVVYDWTVRRVPTEPDAPLSLFPTALLGVDHTTVVGNQFAVRIDGPGVTLPPPDPNATPNALLFATVFAAGVTLNVELNRFSENLDATFLSLLANGDLLNITTLNESTHPIASTITGRTLTKLLVNNNLVIRQPTTAVDYISLLKPTLQEFLRLTFRPPR